ncbi:MAG: hypothetical protein ACLP9S_02210 [Syntrophales bacterium]
MIYLCHAAISPKRIYRKLSVELEKRGAAPAQWLFLGRDYLRFKEWNESLGPEWQHLDYSQQLQSLALKWREPYLDWLTELGKHNDNLAWWSSSISERNTDGDSLYHSICYLRIGLDFLIKENPPSLVIVESRAVSSSLASHPALRGRVSVCPSHISLVKDFLKWPAFWAFYFLDGLRAMLDAYITRRDLSPIPPPTKKQTVLIHSCMDEGYFGDDGTAHDRYFGPLAEELRQRGYGVMIMPWLYNLKRSRRKAFIWFRQHPGQYLIPEDFYSLWDFVWAASVVMRQLFLLPGDRTFQDMEITLLVREARWQQSRRIGAAKFILYYRMIEKISRRDMQLEFFVDTFENMITEKPQVLGFRRFMPKVTAVGFQHYGESLPLMLCLFTTIEEATFAPQPDVIVCNSPHMVTRMARMGFPRHKLRVGPSLRYRHLMGDFAYSATESNNVLVILPLGTDIIAELIDIMLLSFSDAEGMEFWLKPHPMLSRQELCQALGQLPKHFSVIEGNMDQWLPRASCVVVSASTSAFEAALAGVPVVVVGRETDFDLNPLAWFPEFAPPAHSRQELRDQVLRCLNLSQTEREELRAWARKLREQAISPITDETIAAFVQPRS